MQAGEFPARFRERPEIGGERDARQFAFEIGGEALAVGGMMQQRVEVMEDVFAGDGGVGVARAELLDGGVFEVGEREALLAPPRGRWSSQTNPTSRAKKGRLPGRP